MTKPNKSGALSCLAEAVKTEAGKKLVMHAKEAVTSKSVRKAFNAAKKAAKDKVTQTVTDQLSKIPDDLRKHIDVDTKNKRVFLSNTLILKASVYASSLSDDIHIIDLHPVTDGYICRARVAEKTVKLKFTIEQLVWDHGQVSVEFSTPDGVEVEGHSVINYLSKSIIWLFGGTQFGEAILSAKFPPTFRWDGKRATCSFDFPKEDFPGWIQSSTGVMHVGQDAQGLWFSFDEFETLARIVSMLLEGLAKHFYRRTIFTF